ncbi:MAG TPA: hypothetical protein LFV90_05015 [Rickettsia endosymbiont of Columbicola hoogstraali]|nr:hypothetical protein [Rickettsia endosymbiont of Columbicola hoogstraali]
MNLIFNPPTTSKSEINISYDAICRTQEYFSNKKLVDNPETNDEIINYYLKSFEAISEKQYFNSIKENTGTVLNGADKKTLDFIINDRKPKIKPTITFQKNNKLHEIYCDAEKDISITIVYDRQNNNEEVKLSGYPNLLEIINHFFSI